LRTNHKRLLNAVEYYPFRALLALLRLFPYRCSRALVIGLFVGIGYGIGIRRNVAEIQLSHVYPHWHKKKLKKVLRNVYRQMALNICEEYLMSDDMLNAKSQVKGFEYLQEAMSLNKGVIMATAHFGNWEAARILPMRGIPLSVIAKGQRNKLFDNYTNSIRERQGLHVIDMSKGLRDIMQDLSENRVVAILADQNAGKRGIVMDFLGFPASNWKGVAKISLRYHIPIVPGFVVRSQDDKISFEFSKMIYHPNMDDSEKNYTIVINEIIQITEKYIHEYPDHWFWVHKRWKHAYDMFKDIKKV